MRPGKDNSNWRHGMSATPEHEAWRGMIRRCYGTYNPWYHRYGGRGIKVCDRWRHDFSAFLLDVGLRPSSRHSIDRIDNDRDYEPGNVRWSTKAEQSGNRSGCLSAVAIAIVRHMRRRGETVAGIAHAFGVHPGTITKHTRRSGR